MPFRLAGPTAIIRYPARAAIERSCYGSRAGFAIGKRSVLILTEIRTRAYVVGHRGGLRGFEASMWHFAKEGVSVALLSNQGNWFTDLPMERIVEAVLGKA